MMNRGGLAPVLLLGVLASCHAPSSVSATPAATSPQSAATAWPGPAAGRTHTIMPTPKTVAWGWYDAAGEPVLRVA